MITKERIDELLTQKAKIWGIGKSGNVFCVGLKFRPHTLSNKKWLENKYEVYSKFFETKEDAEWHKEFGCIERTERLELPTWEEFQNVDDICFVCIKTRTTVRVFNWGYIGKIYISDEWGISEIFEYNKEGYTIACRKAKELFLGQSNGIYEIPIVFTLEERNKIIEAYEQENQALKDRWQKLKEYLKETYEYFDQYKNMEDCASGYKYPLEQMQELEKE